MAIAGMHLGKICDHRGSRFVMIWTPTGVAAGDVFDIVDGGDKLLGEPDICVQWVCAASDRFVENGLIRQNVLVFNQLHDILVEVVEGRLRITKNHPHILNVSLHGSESEILLLLGSHLLPGGESGDLPLRQQHHSRGCPRRMPDGIWVRASHARVLCALVLDHDLAP